MVVPLRVALVAGEASGDLLGAGLMQALRAQHPDIEFAGIGGDHMIAAGLISRVPMERLSVMGLTEVLGRLPELLGIRRALTQFCLDWQPDVFIGIDAPDFNLGLEISLRTAGIKTVHYVSPSVWAWRKGRIKKIRRAVDHMLTLLPFEATFYQREQIPVTFVGHILADRLPMTHSPEILRQEMGLISGLPVVAMLPGSRGSEVKTLTALFLTTLTRVQQQIGPIQVVIPAANALRAEQIAAIIAQQAPDLNISVLDQRADDALAASDAVLVASGTATLQAMLWKKPMVVAYKLSVLSHFIISRLAIGRWVALPNILAERDWVPERLQAAATPERLAEDLIRALEDADYRNEFVAQASEWHRKLACNADQRAAQAVLTLVGR
jgi:lipid-A-disaccharide synthase